MNTQARAVPADGFSAVVGPSNSSVGPLIENFVIGEIARQLTWAQTRARLFHYRTKGHSEELADFSSNAGIFCGVDVNSEVVIEM